MILSNHLAAGQWDLNHHRIRLQWFLHHPVLNVRFLKRKKARIQRTPAGAEAAWLLELWSDKYEIISVW
jgi:hypothetical protein